MNQVSARLLRRRGFTLIEVMLVLAIIGCLSVLCIPLFQRFAARARKAELNNVLGKVELNFRNNYQATGTYGANIVADWNPPLPADSNAAWDSSRVGWQTYPFPPEGSLHLRYRYTIADNTRGEAGKKLILEAQGVFLGLSVPWTYTQTFENGEAPPPPTEIPTL